MSSNYQNFLAKKSVRNPKQGFKPLWIPDCLFPFQRPLVSWAIQEGRCALLESCGMGKSVQELVWAENVIRYTNGNILFLTPLSVGQQMVREGEKFGIKTTRTKNGRVYKGINITNYQQLHKYSPSDFVAVVADECSVMKDFSTKTRKLLTQFLLDIPYRLICTATPAPNDFMELGSYSEALGIMPRNQMLGMFFTNDGETTQKWRLKGHAKVRFWQWMASWARAVRMPSDIGFDDGDFKLPPLNINKVIVKSDGPRKGFLPEIAKTLREQRKERKLSLERRCAKAAELLPKDKPGIGWVHFNPEGDLLTDMISGAVQVTGSDSDEKKEETLNAFSCGQIRTLITKPSIAGFGLNWQHCCNVTYFPSFSHEKFYQAIRRSYRFGQKETVNCYLIYTEAEASITSNMLRKERQCDELYAGIVRHINDAVKLQNNKGDCKESLEIPSWLLS